jgi:DNA-3-methyladenine glycosylase II
MSESSIQSALTHLGAQSPILSRLIKTHGPYTPRRASNPDVFKSLAKAIIYQQLAGKAAGSIHKRFVDLLDGTVSPEQVLALDPDIIRSAGLSGAKRDAVIDLAQHTIAGRLVLEDLDLLDDNTLTQTLIQVRGIGPWTAQMFMLSELGRLDVWPTGDLGVRKGFALAFETPTVPTAKALGPLGDSFRPYRSIVAWYCWQELDNSKS